jgi:hypothetical protein
MGNQSKDGGIRERERMRELDQGKDVGIRERERMGN